MKKILFPAFIVLLVIAFFSLQENTVDKGGISKKELFDMPVRAAELDYERMKDPSTGKIPFEKYPVAMQQTLQEASLSKNMQTLTWTQIPGDMGGRTKAICLDPNDAMHHKLWAGAATGGLWVNNNITDTNSEWIPVGDVWETLSISSICFDPNDSQIMYVGTGEYETAIVDMYRESSGRGYGIWKSTDGGQTFMRLLSTQDFAYISDLVVKNEGGQSVVYAGVVSGIYRGATFNAQPSEGLYRSADGGQTWEQVLPDIPGTNTPFAPSDIEITANGRIFVGTKRNMNDEGGACILMSDAGNPGSWSVNNQFQIQIQTYYDFNIPGRVKLASAPSNPNRIYAAFAAKSLQQTIEDFPQTVGKIIAKSDDAGNTWNMVNLPQGSQNNWAYLAWHALSLAVDPNDENTLFAGGLDVHISKDAGASWQQVSDWTAMYAGGGANYVHGDIHRFVFQPGSSDVMYIATDGGVFTTQNATDASIEFQKRNKSFNTLQYYSAAISKVGDEWLLGGLQDNGSLLYMGSGTISESYMIQGGDGAFCTFDEDEEGLMITSTYDNQFVAYNMLTFQGNYINNYASGLFTSTFDYDSQNDVIWAIASDLHNNRLNEVLQITDILGIADGQFIDLNTNTDKYFSAIRLIDDDNLIIGTANGKLYKVNNINSNPVSTQIDNGVFPAGFISSIQTGNGGQRILVTISNYGVPSVWQTLDGGITWSDVEGNLPDMPVRWAIYHPQNANAVMLATETGIWTTEDINALPVNWTPQNNGFPNVRVDMLDVRPDNNKVVAGTHGRTMFTSVWDVSGALKERDKMNFELYPNPASGFINISIDEDKQKIEIIDLNGKICAEKSLQKGENRLDISGLKKGYYLVKIQHTIKKLIVE